jgi:hypothetical protein
VVQDLLQFRTALRAALVRGNEAIRQ